MIKLHDFRDKRLNINWRTIQIGWNGPGKFLRQLTEKEIIDYAIELVTKAETQPEDIWTLAGLSVGSSDEIDIVLGRLVDIEKSDFDIEMRKWRVLLVNNALDNLKNEPLYDLIALTEVWEKFNYPADSPHIVQGFNNSITPQEYYDNKNLEITIKQHRDWVDAELKSLRNNDTH